MTNLEHYKHEISDRWMGYVEHRGHERYNDYLGLAIIDVYIKDLKRLGLDEPATAVASVMHWLVREYQEPIKLKRWEKDLLKCYQETKDDGEFEDHYILKEMQYKGHFQNVDYNLTIEEILDNCEVVEG